MNTKELKSRAAQRLEGAAQAGKIVLIYCGLVLGSAAAVTVVNYLLGLVINQSGGLGNMGLRTMLSTVQTLLPLIRSLMIMAIDLGFLAVMLRIARGQYASPQTIRLGFARFWPLLRLQILKGLIFFGIALFTNYAAMAIFFLTPLGKPAVSALLPLVSSGVTDPAAIMASAAYGDFLAALLPMLAIWALLFLPTVAPVAYRYRMAYYLLIDNPRMGAMAAMRESRFLMQGRKVQLFRLDLSFWWYYAALSLAAVVCYGDQILPMLGVSLSGDWSFFLTYGAYLLLEFAIYYLLRCRVEVTYALYYDDIRPKETSDGVVLGNIFQM